MSEAVLPPSPGRSSGRSSVENEAAVDPVAEPPVLSATDVGRTVDRIAHQIIEKLAGSTDAVLLGIPTRGAPLARRLGTRIAAFGGGDVPVGSLDITLFRDDLRHGRIRPLAETVEPSGGIDGKLVILVDDVLFSGRSVRAALDAVRELGRPRGVQLAVLVDRGHRELPIRADYVGKNLPTARAAVVRVRLREIDGEDAVYISEREPHGTNGRGSRGNNEREPHGTSGRGSRGNNEREPHDINEREPHDINPREPHGAPPGEQIGYQGPEPATPERSREEPAVTEAHA